MSWSGIASNQTVSCNNLQDGVDTGVFIPTSTIPVSQKQITKTEASSYVALDTSYPSFSSKFPNQLVVKSDLEPLLYSNRIYGVDDVNPYTPPGVPTYGTVIYSSNSGITWSSTTVTGYSVSRSGRGQYVLTGTQTNNIKVSSDYGVTWTTRSCSLPASPISIQSIVGTAVSSDGQYMYIITYGSNTVGPSICKSSNYGVTWSEIYYSAIGSNELIEIPYPKIACSGDGRYITCVVNKQNNSFDWGSRIIKSSNFGVSFSVSGDYNLKYWTDVAINTSGQYQLLSQMSGFGTGNTQGEGRIYLSSNYGASFIEKTYDQYYRALYCDMSENGQYMLVALVNTNNTLNKFYFSTNYGVSFTVFDTNPPIPAIGQTPGGVFVNSDGTFALVTYIDSAEITYNNGITWSSWASQSIPTAYTFGGLSKSRFLDIPGTTTTTTSTTANPNYDYYLADEYNCSGCNITSTNVLVGFPTGTSVIINRFYADIGVTGFVYQITQSTSPGSPAVLLTLPSATTCNGACIL
jgi:hypothetical protein